MSSVAISGNASGSGVLTISAPNTANNYTLSLPAETGTLVTNNTPGLNVSKIQPITATVSSNSLTVTLNPTALDFRSSTLGSGTTTSVSITSAISLTVPSGTTLNTINGTQSRLAVIALYNSGTPELAVTNMTNGFNLDETTVITTSAIATASTFTGSIAITTGILTLVSPLTGTFAIGQNLVGASVPGNTYVTALLTGTLGAAGSTYSTNITPAAAIAATTMVGTAGYGFYSTTAQTSQPFRVVGYIESTQAAAGTWVTAPSTIQGQGGQALVGMNSVGYSGQTWTSLTLARVKGTTYTNTTGKPIEVFISMNPASGSNNYCTFTVGGIAVAQLGCSSGAGSGFLQNVSVVVPIGVTYVLTQTLGATSLTYWSELR